MTIENFNEQPESVPESVPESEAESEAETDTEFESQLFDGELLKRRLGRFLNRLNTALAESQQHMPDFEIDSIWVDTVVGINGNISFPSGAGIGLEYSRSIQFILKPRKP